MRLFSSLPRVLLLTFIFVQVCSAAEISGRVIGIIDGDTIDILVIPKQKIRIRLAGIDAPEKRQGFGQVAKQTLSDLIYNKDVRIEWTKKDRNDRIIGKVLSPAGDINLELIRRGLAWHYKKYEKEQSVTDRKRYADEEHVARARRVGLWSDDDPVPPWDFRPKRKKK